MDIFDQVSRADDYGVWNSGNSVFLPGAAIGVQSDVGGELSRCQKIPNLIGRFLLIDSDEQDLGRIKLTDGAEVFGKRSYAGTAPGGPEVKDNDLVLMITESECAAIELGELKVRSRRSDQ